MIIKKIEIENFRSYYKTNVFEVTDGLNLIIGSNGDGKTTFYDALEWLFRTDGIIKADTKLISKKREEELFVDDSDDVRVAMTYEQNGMTKMLEKSFHFTKSFDSQITTSNYTFNLYEQNGVERSTVNGIRFEHDLPAEIKKFIMFKGESDLDVFQKSNALQLLIENFSDVKDFGAYDAFMKFATSKASAARDHAQKLDKKNESKIRSLKKTITEETDAIATIDAELNAKLKDATNFDSLLKNIEQNKESSELLRASNRRINSLSDTRNQTAARINENYTISLLDDYWVLMNFLPVAEEYTEKVNEIRANRQKLERDYHISVGAQKAIKKIQTDLDFVPLPVHIPGPQIMKEMLSEEVCKICGRKAEKGSDPWLFMQHKLEEYMNSLKTDANDEEVEPYYENDFIGELQKKDTSLTDNLNQVARMRHNVKEAIAFNNRLHNDIDKLDIGIEQERQRKNRILAQSDGLSEEQLCAEYENISNWSRQKGNAERRIDELRRQKQEHSERLTKANDELSQLSKGTTAAIYAKTFEILSKISAAFESAKETNKRRLLQQIEDEANEYLSKLNIDDFKGTIRIIDKTNGQGEVVLMNDDDTRIFIPNTALKTTYLMSVLFAIGKISSKRRETEFPLLFDAPTSSFTSAKENEFFDVISKLDRQVIIVTKSYLKEDGETLDTEKTKDINGSVFRIQKKKPFNDKKLGTIQTVITKIK